MVTRRRKKTSGRRGASRPGSPVGSAFAWFLAGLLIGLGISALLFVGGFLPDRPGKPVATPAAQPAAGDPVLVDEPAVIAGESEAPRFDFFTVLPEMEVIVPEQELSNSVRPANDQVSDAAGAYILQVGSFRNAADAEQMKARLALLGTQAGIQTVTVNDATWHRVRVGPVEGARRADEIRRLLQDNGFNPLVLKASP